MVGDATMADVVVNADATGSKLNDELSSAKKNTNSKDRSIATLNRFVAMIIMRYVTLFTKAVCNPTHDHPTKKSVM